jgi:hypothetical protein
MLAQFGSDVQMNIFGIGRLRLAAPTSLPQLNFPVNTLSSLLPPHTPALTTKSFIPHTSCVIRSPVCSLVKPVAFFGIPGRIDPVLR